MWVLSIDTSFPQLKSKEENNNSPTPLHLRNFSLSPHPAFALTFTMPGDPLISLVFFPCMAFCCLTVLALFALPDILIQLYFTSDCNRSPLTTILGLVASFIVATSLPDMLSETSD